MDCMSAKTPECAQVLLSFASFFSSLLHLSSVFVGDPLEHAVCAEVFRYVQEDGRRGVSELR